MKKRSIVSRNDPEEAFEIFKIDLVPAIVEVRGQLVEVDLGDYFHCILRHDDMPSRVRWIRETLQNPETIYRHWDVWSREIYVNTIFETPEDDAGMTHLVVIEQRHPALKFWTSFIPNFPEQYLTLVREGELLWKASY